MLDYSAPVSDSPTRRGTLEVRALLVASAEQVFTEKGYADAPLDEIARNAGVARSVLYRHFPSKADLFIEAVLQPFVALLDGYGQVWRSQAEHPWDDDRFMRTLVALIYDSCAAHADVLRRVSAAAKDFEPATRNELVTSINRLIADLVRTVQPESDRRGWVPPESLELSLRLMLGAVASVSVFGDLFLPADPSTRPGRDAIIDHVARLYLHGAQMTGET